MMRAAKALAIRYVQRCTAVLPLHHVISEHPVFRGSPLAAHAVVPPLATPSRAGDDGFSPDAVRVGEQFRVGQLDRRTRNSRIYVRQHGTEVVQLRRHHAISRERVIGWTIRPSIRCTTLNTIGARRERFHLRFSWTGPSSSNGGDGTTIGMHSRASPSQDSGWVCREDEVWCSIVMNAVYTTGIAQNNTTRFLSSTFFFYRVQIRRGDIDLAGQPGADGASIRQRDLRSIGASADGGLSCRRCCERIARKADRLLMPRRPTERHMSQMSLARVEHQGDSPPSFFSSPRKLASRAHTRATFATNGWARVAALDHRPRCAHVVRQKKHRVIVEDSTIS